ncbi:MAG: hypothetical protein H7235_02810 [Bdellovibrionaceae bacterium]|nr:hypothetical protein [Pseudobdellovibrionaceae bacterium]
MKTPLLKPHLKNQSGFIAADFLFSFVLVIGCGMLIFLLTFSLAVVEISQYIVWSTARNYSAANENEFTASSQALIKFKNLSDQFPLLTGSNNPSPWFTLDDPKVGDLSLLKNDPDFNAKLEGDKQNRDGAKQIRQPWIGARAYLNFKILEGVKMPFLGPILLEEKRGDFKFPIRAFILRHPSQQECQDFYSIEHRFKVGIKIITGEDFMNIDLIHGNSIKKSDSYIPIEDNGC